MSYLKLNIGQTKSFYEDNDFTLYSQKAKEAHALLRSKTGPGNDFLGWLDLPLNYDKEEFNRILEAANYIKKNAQVLVVIGIGGSYLGAKSAIEMLKKYFNNEACEIIFVGHHISSTYVNDLIEYLKDKEYCLNVISKSGTTTEPAIAFRIFKELIEEKYGIEESKKRIFATTDKSRGALKELANTMGYETFVVPDNVGGRFSVLTAVGLLPICVSGVDITQMMQGALDAYNHFKEEDVDKNEALIYAVVRNVLYNKGKKIEMLINYEPCLTFFSEWFKQLYGESEGKNHLGIFVASASFSTDLHSMGQMIQDGERTIFETIINVEKPISDLIIKENKENLDGLNFLSLKTVDEVNKKAMQGTILAHVSGGVPNIVIDVPNISAYTYGYLAYFFMFACGVSGYMLGVNPFDQPGVEAYKKNMFALLGKPGFEDLQAELLEKLK